MTSCNWEAWQYEELGENRGLEDSARRLGRSPDEVQRKIDRYCNATFADWYRRTRCPAAPESPHRPLRLAMKIWRDEFSRSVAEGDVENIVIAVLKVNFRRFVPDKGDPDVPVETKFLNHFRYWLRKRFHTHASRNQGWPVMLLPEYPYRLYAVEEGVESGREEHLAWSRYLLHLALPRLEPRMRRVFEMKFVRGLDAAAMSVEMGIAEKTISNKYSQPKLIRAVQEAVNAMTISLPEENFRSVVYYLHYDVGFREKDIADLLCVPREKVTRTLVSVRDTILKGLGRQGAMNLIKS